MIFLKKSQGLSYILIAGLAVGMLAEVVIVDKLLHLKDVVIYGQEQLSGLLRELLQAKTHLMLLC